MSGKRGLMSLPDPGRGCSKWSSYRSDGTSGHDDKIASVEIPVRGLGPNDRPCAGDIATRFVRGPIFGSLQPWVDRKQLRELAGARWIASRLLRHGRNMTRLWPCAASW